MGAISGYQSVNCSLLTVDCSLFAVDGSLLTVRCLLLAAYSRPSTVN
ncbi:MAG: hypothetical protein ICV52_12850 [Microcoleus sp. C1-bin4]|nr:hypothetical protein [Microcoleus sp. C1-bin4]